MKFEVDEVDVESRGTLVSHEIVLSANAKAYRLIFGQIYPDIIKAIVRELFTNAWDSQKVSYNLQTPIDIHLPSKWEPWFSIRDYGVGMSPKIIEEVYSRVFESTKDDSDIEAGMWGMGSKTPLGYTNSFTVTSFINGEMWAYDVFFNKSSRVQIDLKYHGETDEPNGVLVQLAVEHEDFENFEKYAKIFAMHSGAEVNINRERVRNQGTPVIEGEKWVLFDDQSEITTMHIRMGCVLYSLDGRMIINNIPAEIINNLNYDERSKITKWFNRPVIIDFNIGDFQVTGDRENIIYNKESALKIFNFISDILIPEFEQLAIFDTKNAETINDAYLIYQQTNPYLFKDSRELFKWKSWKLRDIEDSLMRAKRLRTSFSINPFSSRSGKVSKSRTPSRYINPSDLYKKNATTYFVIDDNKTKYTYRRLENLVEQLNNAGSKRTACGYSTTSKWFNLIIINKDYYNPARFNAILPNQYFMIDIADIEPKKIKKSYQAQKIKDDEALRVCLNNKQPMATSLQMEIDNDCKYYVNAKGRTIIDDHSKIITSIISLQINPNNIAVIPRTKQHLIKKFGLKNLVEEGIKVKNEVEFNQSTLFYHAVAHLSSSGNRVVNHTNTLAEFIGVKYIATDVVYDKFSSDINDNVKRQFEQMVSKIDTKISELFAKHPILKFVNVYELRNNDIFREILTILGEIK